MLEVIMISVGLAILLFGIVRATLTKDTEKENQEEGLNKNNPSSKEGLPRQEAAPSHPAETLRYIKQIHGWVVFFGITLAVSLVAWVISFIWLYTYLP